MRSASLFYSRFWIGGTGRELVRRFTRDHVVVAVYLFTGPGSHMSGLYYLPVATITEHTGIGTAKVRRILDDLDRIGFARYDHAAAMVWVVSPAASYPAASWVQDARLSGSPLVEVSKYFIAWALSAFVPFSIDNWPRQ